MVMVCLCCLSSFWTYLILVAWFIKFCAISFGNREGYFGICDLNNCSGCESHFVHILGCKQRPWFQLLGAFLVWCCIRAHSFCPDSGTLTSLFWLIFTSIFVSWFWFSQCSAFLPQMLFPLGKISVMIYGCLASIIFSGYIIYDTDNLIKRYSYDEYIWAAIALYIDIINLFLSVLTCFRVADA